MGGLLRPETLEALPTVSRWVEHAAVTRETSRSGGPTGGVPGAARHNALQQLDNLRTHPSVQGAVSEGELSLEAWLYAVGTGDIEILAAGPTP